MNDKISAGEIMTTDVITVKQEDDVQTVAKLLLEHKISGMPVVDNEGKVVGIISEADLMFQDKELQGPVYINFLGGIVYLENPQRFTENIKRFTALQVGDLMTKKVSSVEEETELNKIVTMMINKKINRVPVVDKDKKLLGIITRQDIIRVTHGL